MSRFIRCSSFALCAAVGFSGAGASAQQAAPPAQPRVQPGQPNVQPGQPAQPGQRQQQPVQPGQAVQPGQRPLQPGQPIQPGQVQPAQVGQPMEARADAQLAACLLIDNQGEVTLSKFAAERTENAQVKRFAEQMVEDHGQLITKLQRFSSPIGQAENRNAQSAQPQQPIQPHPIAARASIRHQ